MSVQSFRLSLINTSGIISGVSERTGATVGIVIGVIGLCLALPGTVVALNELGKISIFPRIFADDSLPAGGNQGPCGDQAAAITLSTDRARRGEKVTVHGTCFKPGERVQIRVHVEEVGSANANSDGKFTQTITVPQSAPKNFPTSVVATGTSSIRSASAPITVPG
jgi:hypothetical protein